MNAPHRAPDERILCKFCGYRGKAHMKWRGQRWIAKFLWLTLLFPGPIYNYWQWKGRKAVCPECESEHLVPDEGNARHAALKKIEDDPSPNATSAEALFYLPETPPVPPAPDTEKKEIRKAPRDPEQF